MALSTAGMQWFTPSAPGMDPQQKRIMLFMMPVLSGVFFIALPAGLALYWLTNNVLTMVQTYTLTRKHS